MRVLACNVITALVLVFAPAARAQSPADLRKAADASVDRNFLTPTAETLSAGDVAFNSYEIFFAGLTVGVTDRIQVSATTLLPIIRGTPTIVGLSAKGQLIAGDRLRLSVQPDVLVVHLDGHTAGLAGAQVLLDLILDESGRVVLSFTEANKIAFGSNEGDLETLDVLMLGFGATMAVRIGDHVKAIAELLLPGGYDDGRLSVVEEALSLTYGVRFFGPAVAVDLAFVKLIHPDVSSDVAKVLPLGFPLLTFSARF